jgi:hypothetical protein
VTAAGRSESASPVRVGVAFPGQVEVVSTLPRRLSGRMAMDLPHRVRPATSLPVTHITGPAGPSL